MLQNWRATFKKILDHFIVTNNQMVLSDKISIHLFWKKQNPADSVGSDSNLNIRCSSTYFIRDTQAPTTNDHVCCFDRVLKLAYKIQNKNQTMQKLCTMSSYGKPNILKSMFAFKHGIIIKLCISFMVHLNVNE